MIRRRGVLPVLMVLALVLVGAVAQIVRGPDDSTPGGQQAAGASPAPAAPTGAARAVLSALAGVERAYDAGDVRRLCRPGMLVTANGSDARIDFVRRDGRWLLSFGDGGDPLPALAGTT